jgi:hypothetical protein
LDDVASAAALAGLDFVIVTDHGDGTMPSELPHYRSGVLLIEGLEISTDGGHILALGMTSAGYPLGGEARDVIEDIKRMGGMGLAAHPGSPRMALSWADWNLPIDGIEWLNADSAWRDESPLSLAAVLLTYPMHHSAALARLLDRPREVLDRWESLISSRRVVAIAAVDAHAQIGFIASEPRMNLGLALPSYESSFGLMTVSLPGVSLGLGAEIDAQAVLDALRDGHAYSTIDALANPGVLSFTAESGSTVARAGDVLLLDGPVSIRVAVIAPPEARINLLRDGEVIAHESGSELRHDAPTIPGVYRVEVSLPWAPGNPPVPWMLSNPIYVGRVEADVPSEAPVGIIDAVAGVEAGQWVIETSPGSEGAIDEVTAPTGGPEILLRFALSGRVSDSPYVAFSVPVDRSFIESDRVAFSLRADQTMRIDVQVRASNYTVGDERYVVLGERWHRSMYADDKLQNVTIPLSAFTPKGYTSSRLPPPEAIDSLLFVVDTVNTSIGTGGRIWISNLHFGRTE